MPHCVEQVNHIHIWRSTDEEAISHFVKTLNADEEAEGLMGRLVVRVCIAFANRLSRAVATFFDYCLWILSSDYIMSPDGLDSYEDAASSRGSPIRSAARGIGLTLQVANPLRQMLAMLVE